MAETFPDIAVALKQIRARSEGYRLAAEYCEGKHRLTFATDKFRSAFGSLFRAFADNLCAKVIDACVDRLTLTGFSAGGGGEQIAADAWDIWQANRMDLRSGEVHAEALRSGDAYVIVWPDRDGIPVIYPNDGVNCTVKCDPEVPGQLLWAAKAWLQDDKRLRLNMYYPDRIEKYVTRNVPSGLPDNSNGFESFEVPGEPWPLLNPYGRVPMFHFANRGKIDGFGRSELADVIPLQDALNKAIADMLVAMEFVALPQRWATGLETDIDETTGKPKPLFVPGADRVWATAGTETRFGQFEAANLSQFLEVQEKFRKEIATVSNTPIHFLQPPSGDWPSGESLKTAESEFIAKVQHKQIRFGNVWEDVIGFALRIAGKGNGVRLSALWRDPTPRNELDAANVAVLKSQVGVSERQLLREFGYSEDQIERMEQERETGSQQLGDKMLSAFERGQ